MNIERLIYSIIYIYIGPCLNPVTVDSEGSHRFTFIKMKKLLSHCYRVLATPNSYNHIIIYIYVLNNIKYIIYIVNKRSRFSDSCEKKTNI